MPVATLLVVLLGVFGSLSYSAPVEASWHCNVQQPKWTSCRADERRNPVQHELLSVIDSAVAPETALWPHAQCCATSEGGHSFLTPIRR